MNRAVVCFYQNKYHPILELVGQRLQRYADRCSAKLQMIKLPDSSNDPQMDKFFYIGEKLTGSQQYLIIDIDVLVRSDSPDLFSIVGLNRIGCYNEGASFLNFYEHATQEEESRWISVGCMVNLCKLQPVTLIKKGTWENSFVYFNSGVIVLNEEQRKSIYGGFDQKQKSLIYKHAPEVSCSEQALVNYSLLRCTYPIVFLPECFNQLPHCRNSGYLDTCYFSHYAGLKLENKIDDMIKDDRKWSNWGY